MIYDIVIIGAGASGLMCAANLPKKKKVLLIDANPTIGKKITISGGGKCNITNIKVSPSNYLGEESCIEKVLQKFDNSKLLAFFERQGVEFVLRKKEFFFCKDSAKSVVEALARLTKKHSFMLHTKVEDVEKKEDLFLIKTPQKLIKTQKLIVASGGASFPILGASDIALQIAKKFNITYTPFQPALVGWTVQKEQWWFKELSGISVDVELRVGEKRFAQSLLFTHKGVSGPAVLNGSLYWKKGEVTLNFLPNYSLKTLLQGKKQLSSLLPLPKRFVKAFLEHIDVKDKSCDALTPKEKEKLTKLQHYSFAPAGNFGFSKAEVSRGGILCSEIDENFQSKKVPNLYFLGEALEITGELGGYNFQWAFGSGYLCAKQHKL